MRDSDTHPYASVAGSEVRLVWVYGNPTEEIRKVYLLVITGLLGSKLIFVLLERDPNELAPGADPRLLEEAL